MSLLDVTLWVAALAPLAPLGLALYNRLTWPRPTCAPAGASPGTRMSVLIPARNEARNIGPCVQAVLAQGDIVGEVLVYSDESSDETEAIVRGLAQGDARVRLIVGDKLPAGWVGKPHACEVLGLEARFPWLLYLDADVRLRAGGASGLVGAADANDASQASQENAVVVSALPRQLGGTWWLDVVQPLLLLTYSSWLPIAWANQTQSKRLVAGCGQLLLISRAAFDRIGGFQVVRNAVVDDLELCRHARQVGTKVVFLDGHELAECQMYESMGAFWGGFSKNLFLGLGSERNLAVAVALHLSCFLLPYGLVIWATTTSVQVPPHALVLAVMGVAANVLERAMLAARHAQPARAVILHPVAVGLLILLALDSWRRTRLIGVSWAGRTYRGSPA